MSFAICKSLPSLGAGGFIFHCLLLSWFLEFQSLLRSLNVSWIIVKHTILTGYFSQGSAKSALYVAVTLPLWSLLPWCYSPLKAFTKILLEKRWLQFLITADLCSFLGWGLLGVNGSAHRIFLIPDDIIPLLSLVSLPRP